MNKPLADTLADREGKYGSCEAHFSRTAVLLNTLGFRRLHPSGSIRTLLRSDWPTIIIADKLARSCEDILYEDNPHDIAGYARLWERVILADTKELDPKGIVYDNFFREPIKSEE